MSLRMTLSVNEQLAIRLGELLASQGRGFIIIWLQGLAPQTVHMNVFEVGTCGRDISLQLEPV